MIIELLLNVLYTVFEFLTRAIDIPDLPAAVETYLLTIQMYFGIGAKIVAAYTPYEYLLTLFGVMVLVDVGIMIYHFVMWLLKKIPFLGVN